MALACSVLKSFPTINPDSVFLKVVPSGNYTEGGDTLNLAPSSWSDPKGAGIEGYPSNPPGVCPVVVGNVGFTGADEGAYAVVVPGTTLGAYKLQQFAPGGTELTGAPTAYPAGILAGYWIVQVIF